MAAILLAAPSSRAGEVSDEVRRALSTGAPTVHVLVTAAPLPDEPAARRAAALAAPGFSVARRFTAAPVVAGEATREAVAALAKAPGVHVGLDRVVRPSGQVGTAQIGADRLLSFGVTGLGRSIGIVDSGLDLSQKDLAPPGGGSWPGANLVDPSGNLADCSGHGTEVAGVLTGPQGVAPDAGLVVLKVFSERDGCAAARASDVLAAVDWAVSHAPGTDLEALNLSLSGDAPRAGFCDADDPAGAAVFGAARSAGLSVVAAAGNDGRTSGLPWPACLSSVASVGMVYSASSGPVQWGGVASCTDAVTGPDVVPCASNTGPALALLAPGVNWTTTAAGGGQTSGFSGTSAAAPAAAASLVLARQARPLEDPSVALDLLRATGVPVRDPRTLRSAPRVDLASALAAARPIPGGCEGARIPDVIGDALTCAVDVTSLAGTVSTLLVALAIDHPDPSQLVVTLTGPDGMSLRLVDRAGRAGEAVREVFGLTAPSSDPLSAFAGRRVEGRWTLRVEDVVPGGAGRLVSWALLPEPRPDPDPGFPGATAYVATSAHHAGKNGAFFTTDLRLFNADAGSGHDVRVRFVPVGGAAPVTLGVSLPPLSSAALDDVLHDALRTDGYGPILLSADPSVVAATRTATTAARGGSFGLAVPAEPLGAAAAAGTTLVLVPAFPGGPFRLNVGATEVTGQAANVEFVLRDGGGAARAVVPRTVPGGGLVQLDDLYALTGLAPGSSDRVDVRVTGGGGRVAAWATPVDGSSNDGSYVAAHPAGADLLIPAVSRAVGAFASRFVTDLKVSNAGAAPVTVAATFRPFSGGPPATALLTLAVSETRGIPDVLGALFAPAQDVSGALSLTTIGGGAVYASTRTYTTQNGRTFGAAIDPSSPAAGQAGPGRRLALPFLAGSTARRTNVGFVETAGSPTRVLVTLFSPDGAVAASRELDLVAGEAVQWNDVFAELGAAPLPSAALAVDVLDGGRVAAYAIVLDNRTNDGSYFPATLVPTAASATAR